VLESGKKQFLMEQVEYGTKKINFHLKRVNRKTLGIEVHPDLSVWAIAPEKASIQDVKNKIIKRGKWIIKQQHYFEQFVPRTPERMYISGETHLYLGKRYVLHIKMGVENSVKLIGGELIVQHKGENPDECIKKQLTEWYFQHANLKFNSILNERVKLFSDYKIITPILEIRRMKNRWGSCHNTGKIILNPEIIKAPSRCIEYVINHELCHLVHPNHGKEFYDLQQKMMPEWERWKMKLERILI
jgi:predicted metal-dependent hydrolase